MKILITGGAGFVGSNLAIKLKEKYPLYAVNCLDNLKRRGSELNLPRLKSYDINFIHGDIRNAEDLAEIPPFDCMIDASAEPSVLAGITSPVAQVVNNNLLGTVNCLELAKKYRANFIFLSTSRVYPIKALEKSAFQELDSRFEWTDTQDQVGISAEGVDERFTLRGSRSFYGTTKLASELLIQEYQELGGLNTVINRCGVISGPYQMGKVDQGVIVLWVARHFWKGELGYFGYGGTGKQVRDVLHIQDLFELIDLQLHQLDTVSGEIFNVGGGKNNSISLKELTALCQEISEHQVNISSVPENRVADLRIYLTNNQKVNQALGWRPRFSPQDVLQDIFDWIEKEESVLKHILK